MRSWLLKNIHRSFPKNYVFRNPEIGTLAYGVFCFTFTVLYTPLHSHPSAHFGYATTMGLYTLAASIALWGAIKLLGYTKFFSTNKDWTILKELLAIMFVLFAAGIAVFSIGFVLEPVGPRWSLFTFTDAVGRTMLIGAIPFLFLTAISASTARKSGEASHEEKEKHIHIKSQLKKEDLRFLPSQLLYAESEGNYVTFHLLHEKGVKTKSIRNSISQIEEQLKDYPHIIRTHRAFIVNLKYVTSSQGNSAGYKLRLENIGIEVPVSRQKAEEFEAAYRLQQS